MATVKLLLNRHRALKNGTYPLVFQLIHQRKKKLIYTSYKLFEGEFNTQTQTVRFVSGTIRSVRDVRLINRELKDKANELREHIIALEARGRTYTVSDIVTRYNIGRNRLSLLHYMDLLAVKRHAMKRYGMESALRNTRASLAGFTGSTVICLSEIDIQFVSEYELYLRKRGVSPNTVCYYMRNLKSVFRQAKSEGYPVATDDPFEHIHSKPRKTTKRALKRTEIQKIYHLNLTRQPHLEFARDIFMFSFFCRGMPFVDVIYLTKSCLSAEDIHYYRHKTDQSLQIALTPQLKSLIAKYDSVSPFVFPILNGDDEWDLHRQYRKVLERVNRNLKQLGRICNIGIPLTTYVARHTWATLAKEIGTSAAIISEGLGHTNEKTTQIYLKEFDHKVVDKVNEQVSEL